MLLMKENGGHRFKISSCHEKLSKLDTEIR